ncbi:MAG: primosomal protein N' [Bacteroidetes bacterium]|nr:primosomal protein N' [Bacteroidota bacterium]
MESQLPFYALDDAETATVFVDVVLPIPVQGLFTYRIPRNLEGSIQEGMRVIVQFGARKVYAAIVVHVHETPPGKYTAKYILDVLDAAPIVHPEQLDFWKWIAAYYCCTLGEVMDAALPANMKLESETQVLINPESDWERYEVSDNEYVILEALQAKKTLAIGDIAELLQLKTVMPIIKSLYEKGFLLFQEEIADAYRPRKEVYVRPLFNVENKEFMKDLMEKLESAPRQLDLLLMFLKISKGLERITKKELLKAAGAGATSLDGLVNKAVFELYEEEVDRLQYTQVANEIPVLNPEQKNALQEIKENFENKDVALLHGITGSGKTHIYMELIEEAIKAGKQSLFLVPEIALTAQLIQRLRLRFKDEIGIYHSRFNNNERVEIWNKVLTGQYKVVLGARSALFLPYKNLGFIVVDEEHETSYKQFEPAPRYHTRDGAIFYASMVGAKTLLGSATPSFESYFNAQRGKYGLVNLNNRFGDIQMPEIKIANLRDEQKKKLMKSHFSSVLMAEMKATMEGGGQVILFQNRRGYAPMLQCMECGWTPECKNCDISLTYHQNLKQLVCHYCGYHEDLPKKCGKCGNFSMKMLGFGTEKIEDELGIFFPDRKTLRMDQDTTRKKHSFNKIIQALEDGEADILVGTQMVTKGMDFEKVRLVGILSADQLLRHPDFRAMERCFSLISQVSGRAGRRNIRGKVVVQSYSPEHPIFNFILANDYEGFYKTEINDRLFYRYPPFYKLIKLIVRDKEEKKAQEAASWLSNKLKDELGSRVLGAEAPAIGRIRNYYIRQIMVKIERTKTDIDFVKNHIMMEVENFNKTKDYRGVKVAIDVDPY